MKRIAIFIFLFLVTSCVMDRVPQVRIKIDEGAINKIDSLELITNSYYSGVEKVALKVEENKKEYIFINAEDMGTIRLMMKDKTSVVLDSVKLKSSDLLRISQINGTYKAEPTNKSKLVYFLIVFLVGLLVVFLTKVASALIIINPDSGKDFIMRYGLIHLIFVFVSAVLISATSSGILFFFLAVIAAFFIDFNFLYKYNQKAGIMRPFIAAIVGNVLLFTVGVVLFFMIAMYL